MHLRQLSFYECDKLGRVLTLHTKKALAALIQLTMEKDDIEPTRELLFQVAEGGKAEPETLRLIRRVLMDISDESVGIE